MCMLTNSLTVSNYAIGAKSRYLYLWVLAGSGYLWVAGNPYEMRDGLDESLVKSSVQILIATTPTTAADSGRFSNLYGHIY